MTDETAMDHRTESFEESHRYVRLALPLMAKHQVPVTPPNYTVWYRYVSGQDAGLGRAIGQMIEDGRPFSQEMNDALFNRYCAPPEQGAFRRLREELKAVLVDVLNEVSSLGGQTEHYEAFLSSAFHRLDADTSIQALRSAVNEIIDETRKLTDYSGAMQRRLEETSSELQRLKKDLERAKAEAVNDFMTGIPNRKAFDERLKTMSAAASSADRPLALLLIDIDHFKHFNDRYGHIIGDEVLKFVARKIRELIRGRDFLARFGGEEFAVLLPQTDLAGTRAVAENIRIFFAQSKLKAVKTSEALDPVTVSIGMTLYRPGEAPECFIGRADQALYVAKNSGRNRAADDTDLSA